MPICTAHVDNPQHKANWNDQPRLISKHLIWTATRPPGAVGRTCGCSLPFIGWLQSLSLKLLSGSGKLVNWLQTFSTRYWSKDQDSLGSLLLSKFHCSYFQDFCWHLSRLNALDLGSIFFDSTLKSLTAILTYKTNPNPTRNLQPTMVEARDIFYVSWQFNGEVLELWILVDVNTEKSQTLPAMNICIIDTESV